MFKLHPLKSYVKYSLVAALLYCITVAIFIYRNEFAMSYILYIGNALFAACIAIFVWLYNKKRWENANVGMMIYAGHIVTVMGIIIACVISILLLLLIHSGDNQSANQIAKAVEEAPPGPERYKSGLLLAIFLNAIVGNVSAGSFISVILPYSLKRNQIGNTAEMDKNEVIADQTLSNR